jgi:hypothetical protein
MTDHEWILAVIKQYRKITPAKMGGIVLFNKICPADISRRCRELRKKGILISHKEGRFEVFELANMPLQRFNVLDDNGNVIKKIEFV